MYEWPVLTEWDRNKCFTTTTAFKCACLVSSWAVSANQISQHGMGVLATPWFFPAHVQCAGNHRAISVLIQSLLDSFPGPTSGSIMSDRRLTLQNCSMFVAQWANAGRSSGGVRIGFVTEIFPMYQHAQGFNMCQRLQLINNYIMLILTK